MTNLAIHHETNAITLPSPRVEVVGGPINIRPAILKGADCMFIDALQKKHSKMVGFMPMDQIQKRIKAARNGGVLIAQDPQTTERLGYCIFADKYFKREDLGIVYQLNIVPDKQRGLVGAALVKAAFEACPWGVKLFCCWCAQDLAACHFWESIGFVPIAFRAGSRGKAQGGRRKEGRMQIFWQRRIREGDEGPPTGTPYWYPTETSGGSMKENRIVLPIPFDRHWSDDLPFVLPGIGAISPSLAGPPTELEGGSNETKSASLTHPLTPSLKGVGNKRQRKPKAPVPPQRKPTGGLWFAPPPPPPPTKEELAAAKKANAEERTRARPAPPKQRFRNDPELVAAARGFRDRYLDEVNTGRMLPAAWGAGKYDVSRQLEAGPPIDLKPMPLLKAA